MNIKTTRSSFSSTPPKGIALLIAVIFSAVMLSIGIALSSLGYKQIILSSTASASQKAFYAADTALECVLSAVYGQPQGTSLSVTSISCNGNSYPLPSASSVPSGKWDKYSISDMQVDHTVGHTVCANSIIYWPKAGTAVYAYVYTTGYNNANCSITPYTTTQGLQVRF